MLFIYVTCILIPILLLTFCVLYYFTKRTFARGPSVYDIEEVLKNEPEQLKRITEGRNELRAMPCEEHTVASFDSLKLFGYLYRTKEKSDKYIICMHGYRSSPEDFMCAMGFFISLGYNVLTVNQRAHGKSEGKWITFGVKERYDCLSWCNYLVNTFGNGIDIVLDGLSMGATTVLMASALDLPKNVKGIIADCGFSSPWDIVTHVAKTDMHIPKFPLLYLMLPAVKVIAGFGLKEASTVDSVTKSNLPILYTHGLADDFVPHGMSIKAYNARPDNSRMLSVEGAKHGLSYIVDEEKCKNELRIFLTEAVVNGRFPE